MLELPAENSVKDVCISAGATPLDASADVLKSSERQPVGSENVQPIICIRRKD